NYTVQPADNLEFNLVAIRTYRHYIQLLSGLYSIVEVWYLIHFCAVQPQRLRGFTLSKLKGQYTHTDEVTAVDALVAFGNNCPYSQQECPLCRPVARRSAAVLLAC